MIYHVQIGGRSVVVEVGAGSVTVDGAVMEVDMAALDGGPVYGLRIDGASHRLAVRRGGEGRWEIHTRGRKLRVDVIDERTAAIRALAPGSSVDRGPRPIVAPMPGMVVRVEVAEGDVVAAGQGVVIVEAMKMENELLADAPGRVVRVHVRQGEAVEKDQRLVDLGPLSESPAR